MAINWLICWFITGYAHTHTIWWINQIILVQNYISNFNSDTYPFYRNIIWTIVTQWRRYLILVCCLQSVNLCGQTFKFDWIWTFFCFNFVGFFFFFLIWWILCSVVSKLVRYMSINFIYGKFEKNIIRVWLIMTNSFVDFFAINFK